MNHLCERLKAARYSIITFRIVGIGIGVITGLLITTGFGLLPLFAISLLLFLLPLFIARKRKRFDVFEPVNIFVILYFLVFWLRPLQTYIDFDISIRYFAKALGISREHIQFGFLLALTGLIVFYFGYYSKIGQLLSRWFPKIQGEWKKSRVRFIISLLFILVIILWIWHFGKGEFSIVKIYMDRMAASRGGGDLSELMRVSIFLLSAVSFSYFISKRQTNFGKKIAFIIPIILSIFFTVFGNRTLILWIMLPPFIIWHYLVKQFTKKQILIIFILIALFVTITHRIRTQIFTDPSELKSKNVGAWLSREFIAQTSPWDGLLVILNHYPKTQEFYYGRIMFEDFFLLIPRRFWSEKPFPYGTILLQMDTSGGFPGWFDPQKGIGHLESYSALGTGYADFGVFGALVTMFITGVVLRTFYEVFKRNEKSIAATILLALTLLHILLFLRGFMIYYMHFFVRAVLVLLVLSYLCKGKSIPNFLSFQK